MHYLKVVLVFIITAYLPGSSQAQVSKKGLIAHYLFDKENAGVSGQEIIDESKHKNSGKYIGNAVYVRDRHGVECRALSFDGSSYISVSSSRSLSSPSTRFSAAVWVKIANGADFFKQWLTILCKSSDSMEIGNSPHYRVQATAQTVSINTEFTENFIPQLSYDTWYHYVYVYDGSHVKVYIDGKLVFEYNYRGRLYPNAMPLEIGRDLPGITEYFYGALDDLRIYNRALSDKEVKQLYQDRSGIGLPDACLDPPPIRRDPAPRADSGDIVFISPIDTTIYPDSLITGQTPEKKTNVTDSIPPAYDDLPNVIDDKPVEYQQTVVVKSQKIKIYPYDNEKEDGDIVSININGVWVRNHYSIKKKKSKPLPGDYIHVSLNEGGQNYIISEALNVGSIPPNTLTLEIDDGVSIQEIMINSDRGKSGGIRIVNGSQ